MAETRHAFHRDLEAVRTDVVRLGALASESIQAGTDALLDDDLAGIDAVVAGDAPLDRLTRDLEARIAGLLAQQAPMAGDLRALVTTLRIINELERIGDLMVKVAKAGRRLHPHPLEPRVRGLLDRMRAQAAAQLGLAIDAFVASDPSLASAVHDMDDMMDELQKDLLRHLFSASEVDDLVVQRAVQVALVGRFFERIGDHATNVADRVIFAVTGRFPGRSPSAG